MEQKSESLVDKMRGEQLIYNLAMAEGKSPEEIRERLEKENIRITSDPDAPLGEYVPAPMYNMKELNGDDVVISPEPGSFAPNQPDGIFIKDPTKLLKLTPTQYFTPDIEDMYVGYECEWRMPRRDWITYHDEKVYDWQTTTLDIGDFDQNDLANEFSNVALGQCEFRTPYITMEQIEKEGWEKTANDWKKGEYSFKFLQGIQVIFSVHGFSKFCGQCKDINTFRQICKLIGI